MVGEHPCECDHERLLGVDGATTQLDAADVVALIDNVKKHLDVVAHDVATDEVHHTVESLEPAIVVTRADRAKVAVNCRDHLAVSDRGDELTRLATLRPADPAVHHEGAIVRQLVQHVGHRA